MQVEAAPSVDITQLQSACEALCLRCCLSLFLGTAASALVTSSLSKNSRGCLWPPGPPHNRRTPLALLEGYYPKAKKEITKAITESHPPQLRRHCAHINGPPDRFTRPGVHRAHCLATAVTHDSDSFAIAGSYAEYKRMQNFMRMNPKVLTRETLTDEQLGEILACNYSDSTLESFNLPTRPEDDVEEWEMESAAARVFQHFWSERRDRLMSLATEKAEEEEEERIRYEMGLATQSEDDSEEEGSEEEGSEEEDLPVESEEEEEEDEDEVLTAAFAFQLLHESVPPGLGVHSEAFCDHSEQCCGDYLCASGHRDCGCGYDPECN